MATHLVCRETRAGTDRAGLISRVIRCGIEFGQRVIPNETSSDQKTPVEEYEKKNEQRDGERIRKTSSHGHGRLSKGVMLPPPCVFDKQHHISAFQISHSVMPLDFYAYRLTDARFSSRDLAVASLQKGDVKIHTPSDFNCSDDRVGFSARFRDSAAEYGRSSYILHSSAIHHGIKQACPDGRSSGPRRPSCVWYRGTSSVRLRHGQLGMAISAFGERAEVADVFQLDGEVDVAGTRRTTGAKLRMALTPAAMRRLATS